MPPAITTEPQPTEDDHETPPPAVCPGCQIRAAVVDNGVCAGCRRCADCEQADAAHNGRPVGYDDWVCDDCLRDRYWYCSGCDGWNRDGEACANCNCNCNGDEDDEDDDYDDESDELIEVYEYKPRPVFHGDGPLYLGPEIEVETLCGERHYCAQIAVAHLGDLGYLKEDSSVDGFEIVTHPMSYTYAMASFPWRMLTALADAGAEATSSCGLHVHVSRAGFTGPCHVFRWMKFVYRNQASVVRLARRHSPDYAAFNEGERRAVKNFAKGSRGDDRHVAINTGNRDTFELRMFASSLTPAVVAAAFGFASASVEYTRTLTTADIIGRGGWTWSAFADWVATQPEYAPLRREMQARACAC